MGEQNEPPADSRGAPGTDWKQVIAWALYDWANSAFAATVMAAFFPTFFRKYWSQGVDPAVSLDRLGSTISLASVVVAVLALLLGGIADRGRAKKAFLLSFAVLGSLATGGLYLVGEGNWQAAAALYFFASVGFYASNIFYDSLLVSVSPPGRVDFMSALGYSLGYLGGGVLLAINAAMVIRPESFGLAGEQAAVRTSFLMAAIWWTAFSLPLALLVRERREGQALGARAAVTAGLRQLARTFQQIRKLRVVFWFLLAYWLYIDGVDTIMAMAAAYGESIGIQPKDLIVALLITQFVGVPAAIAVAKFGERLGPRTAIAGCIGVYLGVTIWGAFMKGPGEFYALAVIVGLVQGGIQALSRSFYTRIIPAGKAAQFFGFYNMLGKFAAVIGPFLMGRVGVATGDPRHSILAVSVLFAAGAAVLFLVNEEEGRKAARELEEV